MIIQLGDQGDYVRAWQRVVGVPGSQVDGVFGPRTDALVRAWQSIRGVETDGVIGPLTRAALQPGDMIKPYEGCVLRAYDDAQDAPLPKRYLQRVGGGWLRLDGTPCRGNPTIGWGTRLWGQNIERCTQEEADRWFNDRLSNTFLPAAKRNMLRKGYDTERGRVAALASLAYNGGEGAVIDVADHDFDPAEWNRFVHATLRDGTKVVEAGLVIRRREEIAMWQGVEVVNAAA